MKKKRQKSFFPVNVHDIRITVEQEQGFSKPYALVITLGVAVLLSMYWFVRPSYVNHEIIACTQEAKSCPDGSSVGRTGLNCEFALCPSEALCEGGVCSEVFPSQFPSADTSNWKTYRNEQYGFEMKYPPEWTHGYDNPAFPGKGNFTHIRLQTDPTRSISIQVTPGKVTFGSKNYKILELNGVEVVKLLDSGAFRIFHRKPDFGIYINDTSKVAEYGNYFPVDSDVIEEIVSTFKFIKEKDESISCRTNADCTLLLCSGARNKEWVKSAPPEPPCARYEGYTAQCVEQKCTAIKP
ncbi:MAG: hypothetical protein U1A25_02260 [Candidatus Sungbacteria bacterium]|nr:hypothetical protein [bacterium]MDZ4260465.1 hypothetical protein [Candidatus Sungbacteria bacterium]